MEKLLLEIFRVCGNNGLTSLAHGVKQRGDEIPERLPDPGGSFHDEVADFRQCRGDRRGHFPLLRAQFKPFAA